MNIILRHFLRLLLIFLFQFLLLKQIDLSFQNFNYIHILVYPLFILLLPLNLSKYLYLVLAFIVGLIVDIFYHSPGVHAAALVLMAFVQPIILKVIEPREGYSKDSSPTMHKMGLSWLFIYTSLSLFIHHFVYFSIEAFSFIYFFEIILRTIFSFIVSLIVIMLSHFIFRPKI